MISEINQALAEIGRQFADNRIHYCQLEASRLEDGSCRLEGAVLDRQTLASVSARLSGRFPSLTFDEAGVQVLRRKPPLLAAVATNLTGLYAGPSFGTEMLSQLLGGWRVERLQEQDRWVYVRQPDGYLGWVYGPYLDGRLPAAPTHLVAEPVALLHEKPAAASALAGRLLAGAGVVAQAQGEWALVTTAGGRKGWLPLPALRPLTALPSAPPEQRRQLVADALRYVGVPYLWGGITALGFDCSGFVQMLHRLAGLAIPRDADMQCAAGVPVEPPFQAGDLLFFGSEGAHRAISHVGLSLGGWRIMHASRSRNGVYVDDVQAAPWLGDIFVAASTFIGEGNRD